LAPLTDLAPLVRSAGNFIREPSTPPAVNGAHA
jgi:hypothetical protein